MAKLYVVRHAQVNVDLSIPSHEWEISEDGINATKNLAVNESWNEVDRIYHSPEPKAVATAHVLRQMTGIPTTSMEDLHELRIPTITPTEEFIRRVGAYLAGSPDPEFEDWEQATTRIVNAVKTIISETNGSSVAMVSHGRILTVLYSHLLRRRMNVTEWQSIQLPDLSIIDLDTWTVEKGFFSQLVV